MRIAEGTRLSERTKTASAPTNDASRTHLGGSIVLRYLAHEAKGVEMTGAQTTSGRSMWHDRADELRRMAERVINPEARKIILSIAEQYERIAKRVDAQRVP